MANTATGRTFTVIDFETANSQRASICQVGVVRFVDGIEAERWEHLVDPRDAFHSMNVAVHGIRAQDVRGKPTFPEIFADLERRLSSGDVVVSHGSFDPNALGKATERFGLDCPTCTWLDTTKVVRRAWPERYGKSGYGLPKLASDLGIRYKAHSAVDDAWAAGQILLQVIDATGIDVPGWVAKVG
jgi:DNA polymerase III subunit epsilon